MTDELRDDEKKALEILRRYSQGLRASYLGSEMWLRPHSSRQPQHFSRPATNLLMRMEKKGLVYRERQGDWTHWKAR